MNSKKLITAIFTLTLLGCEQKLETLSFEKCNVMIPNNFIPMDALNGLPEFGHLIANKTSLIGLNDLNETMMTPEEIERFKPKTYVLEGKEIINYIFFVEGNPFKTARIIVIGEKYQLFLQDITLKQAKIILQHCLSDENIEKLTWQDAISNPQLPIF
ncbi:hypothetical protein [uncultured Shewanella sp.]|uniref:hypothetical protein n=1 Tax=uncultured Shewanella sp. TaxID=173975 RepID=UPI0026289ACB|nr:hypothetical protein [uncultured Shewanella sp.]